jgi:hypothetical protein
MGSPSLPCRATEYRTTIRCPVRERIDRGGERVKSTSVTLLLWYCYCKYYGPRTALYIIRCRSPFTCALSRIIGRARGYSAKKRILYDTRAFIPYYAHRTAIAEACYSKSSQSDSDSVDDWTMDAVCDTP